MKVTISGNTLSFAEPFTETTTVKDLMAHLSKVQELGNKPQVVADFSAVPYANSSAAGTWLRFLMGSKVSVKYVNSPPWLVKQFNMVDGFFANDSYVESFQAQFVSPDSSEEKTLLLKLGTDVPVLKDYSDFVIPQKNINGTNFEIDFEPSQYFAFINGHYELFKSKIR